MDSKEIVRRTLDFTNPERVARTFYDSDLVFTNCEVNTYSTHWKKIDSLKWERTDEWGNIWARIDDTSKGEVIKGVFEGIDDFNHYKFPDFSHYDDYKSAEKAAKTNSHKWVVGSLPGFTFNIARNLFKLENYLCDLLIESEKMHELHDRIDIILEDMIKNYSAAGVDSVMFWEDWGTQNQTMISPDLWYQEFFPRFKKLCLLAHNCNIKVFMHSCGAIASIIPGIIEAGVDLLQFDQPVLHGIDILSTYQENAKITFWCPVDIQKTLQTENEFIIRTEARHLLDKLWKGRGGYIAGYYSDNASIGLEPKWQEYACNEFLKHGKQSFFPPYRQA